jgi:hypothetical protein
MMTASHAACADEFNPDFCVIWGDDQFENYQQDCVPPFLGARQGSGRDSPRATISAGSTPGTNPKTRVSRLRVIVTAPNIWRRFS